MKQRMDVLFNETGIEEDAPLEPSVAEETQWDPPMDVWETSDVWVLKADLPGVRDEDVSVQVSDGVLTVSGVRSIADYPLHSDIHASERPRGAFDRSFALPQDARDDCIQAQLEAGVLTVAVQRKRSTAEVSRRIPVRSA